MFTALLLVIYLIYISLGLPDEIFGSAWPIMHTVMGVPLAAAGAFTITVSIGNVLSSFFSGKLIHHFGTAKITVASIFLTVIGLFSVSFSENFLMSCVAAIPLGLGSGCIDAALNSFVALHFASQHMSWLHCSWGIGAAAGPLLMSIVINQPDGWRLGYRVIAAIQLVIAVIALCSLPLWKKAVPNQPDGADTEKSTSYKTLIQMKGVKIALLLFFLYCGIEYLCGIWSASFFVGAREFTVDAAARMTATFYIGITVGRLISGFLSMKLSDKKLVYGGCLLLAIGIAACIIPLRPVNVLSLLIMGLGCAPIYPCFMHSTPLFFGRKAAPGVIGMQMSAAGLGGMLIPPLFGLIAGATSVSLLPICVLLLFIILVLCTVRLHHKNV